MKCKIEGCEKEARGRGWCPMHYYRWRQYGDPNHLVYPNGRKPNSNPCSVNDCNRKVCAKGFCRMHWDRWQTRGDPNFIFKRGQPNSGQFKKGQAPVYTPPKKRFCKNGHDTNVVGRWNGACAQCRRDEANLYTLTAMGQLKNVRIRLKKYKEIKENE